MCQVIIIIMFMCQVCASFDRQQRDAAEQLLQQLAEWPARGQNQAAEDLRMLLPLAKYCRPKLTPCLLCRLFLPER
jgi:hypothetical protein